MKGPNNGTLQEFFNDGMAEERKRILKSQRMWVGNKTRSYLIKGYRPFPCPDHVKVQFPYFLEITKYLLLLIPRKSHPPHPLVVIWLDRWLRQIVPPQDRQADFNLHKLLARMRRRPTFHLLLRIVPGRQEEEVEQSKGYWRRHPWLSRLFRLIKLSQDASICPRKGLKDPIR